MTPAKAPEKPLNQEMPEDDMHWYPKVIEASIVDEEKKIHGGYFTFDEASGALKEFEIKTYPKV